MVDFSRAQGAYLWALSFWSQPVRATLRPRERDWGCRYEAPWPDGVGKFCPACWLCRRLANRGGWTWRRRTVRKYTCSLAISRWRERSNIGCPALGRTARRRTRGERRGELREGHGQQLFDHGLHCSGRGDTDGGAAGGRQRAPLDRREPGSRAGRPSSERVERSAHHRNPSRSGRAGRDDQRTDRSAGRERHLQSCGQPMVRSPCQTCAARSLRVPRTARSASTAARVRSTWKQRTVRYR